MELRAGLYLFYICFSPSLSYIITIYSISFTSFLFFLLLSSNSHCSYKRNAPATTTTLSIEQQVQLNKLQEREQPTPTQAPYDTHLHPPFAAPVPPSEESRLGLLASAGDLPSLIRHLEVCFTLYLLFSSTSLPTLPPPFSYPFFISLYLIYRLIILVRGQVKARLICQWV